MREWNDKTTNLYAESTCSRRFVGCIKIYCCLHIHVHGTALCKGQAESLASSRSVRGSHQSLCKMCAFPLPRPYTMRNGEPWCRLCWRVATPAHVVSTPHSKRANWLRSLPESEQEQAIRKYERPYENRMLQWPPVQDLPAPPAPAASAAPTQQALGQPPQSGGPAHPVPGTVNCLSPETPVGMQLSVPYVQSQMPAGDPAWYEFSLEHGMYKCRLCNRWADDGHVNSDKHKRRASHPQSFLPDVYRNVPGPPILQPQQLLPPPPPPTEVPGPSPDVPADSPY